MTKARFRGTGERPAHHLLPGSRPALALILMTCLVLLATATEIGPIAGVSSVEQAGASTAAGSQKSRDITIDAQVGIAGVVPAGTPVPLRIILTSTRARLVKVDLNWGAGQRTFRAELGADAPSQLDLTVPQTQFVDISVSRPGGGPITSRTFNVQADPTRTVVALGKALMSQGAPKSSPTIGGIQEARLVELNEDLLDRPGAMSVVSGVVLSAADVDGIDTRTRDELRQWVWSGGDLALDFEARDTLPVVDLPGTGTLTAVGSGWVRFTSGAASAGSWSNVLEPAMIRNTSDAIFGGDAGMMVGGFGQPGMFVEDNFAGPDMVGPGMAPEPMDHRGLIEVSFLPTWLIALAIFPTALVAGPLTWVLLRTRRRRRLMWFAAPGVSLVVAALLVTGGQGVFSRARTNVGAVLDSSPWASRGLVFSGVRRTTTFDLDSGADLLTSQPEAVVTGSGAARSVRIDLPRNAFGTVGFGPVTPQQAPRIEVVAVAKDDGKVAVSVTNHSDGTLSNVLIRGNSRVRNFENVAPGATSTLDFNTSSDMKIFERLLSVGNMGITPASALEAQVGGVPESRGLVQITGTVVSSVRTTPFSGKGLVWISATVPIAPASSDVASAPNSPAEAAAIRIDELGGQTNAQIQTLRANAGMIDDMSNPDDGMSDGMATTTVVEPGTGGSGSGEAPEAIPEFVRFSFPQGRPAATCGVSVFGPELDYWNGTGWSRLAKTAATYNDENLSDVGGNAAEMNEVMFPEIPAGGRLYVRISRRTFFGPPAMLFDCGGRP